MRSQGRIDLRFMLAQRGRLVPDHSAISERRTFPIHASVWNRRATGRGSCFVYPGNTDGGTALVLRVYSASEGNLGNRQEDAPK
jgi:hypothetical protein